MPPGTAGVDRDQSGAAWRDWWPLFRVPAAGAGLAPSAPAAVVVCAAMGNPDVLLLCAAASRVCRARSGGGAPPVERRQASGDLRHAGAPTDRSLSLGWLPGPPATGLRGGGGGGEAGLAGRDEGGGGKRRR